MIIECEGCRSKFNLDERLLKQEGSKVRCSVCKHVFTAYPPQPEFPAGRDSGRMEMEETVALDSPPILAERDDNSQGRPQDRSFQEAFDETADLSGISRREEEPESHDDMGGPAGMDDQDLAMAEPEEEAPSPRRERSAGRFLPILLAIVLILLAGSAGIFYLAPELLPESLSFLKPHQKEEVADVGAARLSFGNVKGGFVQTEKGGQLFLIQGVVTNHYPKERSFILVKGSLLDDKGQVVKTKMAYAGNVFTEEQLKDMPIEEVNKGLKNRSGAQNVNAAVKPEGQVPFSIVIENLPENLSEFTVEAVSSSPAQP
ncbi:MAG: DUF3426 domain-containing protein [Desulfobacteraceae bacterium]|nr:MAG: DUF3426 domain-containing protein [Desulfobacteraceae bacterium]